MLFAVSAVCEAVFVYLQLSGRASFGFLEYLHIAYCIAAILFASSIALLFGERIMRFSVVQIIDRSAYYIYLFHPLVIFEANDRMSRLGIASISKALLGRALAAYLGTILLCGIYTEIKLRVRRK